MFRRQNNKVAHALARKAKDIDSWQVWLEEVPEDIIPHVVSDISSFQ
jgi:hypothetical protein